MNANAKKWIAALESGKYTQAAGHLGGPSGYCCLGVACAVYEKETGLTLPVIHRDNYDVYGNDGEAKGQLNCEFRVVREWLGLYSSEGAPSNTSLHKLTALNDNIGMSFADIASTLKHHEADYFVEEQSNESECQEVD